MCSANFAFDCHVRLRYGKVEWGPHGDPHKPNLMALPSFGSRQTWRLAPAHGPTFAPGAANRSSVGTLVERTSGKVVLIKLTEAPQLH
jgi:hypothetical protein